MKKVIVLFAVFVLFSLPTMAQTFQDEVADSCAAVVSDADTMTVEECRKALRLVVVGEKLMLPREISEGLRLVDCKLEGNAVLFVYSFDEKHYPYEMLLASRDVLREDFKKVIAGSELRHLMELCLKTNSGVSFLLYGTMAGCKLRLDFTTKDVRDILEAERNRTS